MAKGSQAFALECPPASGKSVELIFEVHRGLLTQPRSLAPWMFYDDVGSELFERITTLPEYYLTRKERGILASHADAILAEACADKRQSLRIVELGAGTASKTATLLECAARQQTEVLYMPVDVSADALNVACQSIDSSFPDVHIEPLLVNYVAHPLQLDEFDGSTLALYLGSSIGNFSPGEAKTILRNLGQQLQARDALVLGTDLVKDESVLVDAYDDNEGITASFNSNILRRLNKELGADFDLDSFRHHAVWNSGESRIEMHLQSTRAQTVSIAAMELSLHFREGETIHTENSCKFSDLSIKRLLRDSCFEMKKIWKDEDGWYAVTLARPQGLEYA